MRLRKAGLRRRINGQLTLRYEAGGLTSFAGLELVGRFIRRLDFRATLRRVERALPRSDFGAVRLSMLVLAMLIAGARRVRHVCYLANDPLVERLCGLTRLPSWHTLGRWLRGFDAGGVKALLDVNERLVAEVIDHSGLPRLTLDVDGSVVLNRTACRGRSPGLQPAPAQGAQLLPDHGVRGEHGPGAQGLQPGRATYTTARPQLAFLGELFKQLRATLKRRPVLEMRMDGAFFQAAVIDVLDAEGALNTRSGCRFGAGWDSRSASPDAEHGSAWTTRWNVSISGFGCRPGHA